MAGGGTSSGSTFDSTEGISAYFVFFCGLLALVLVACKLLHDRPRLSSVLPEAGLILLVGIVAGSIVNLFVAPHIADRNDENGTVAESLLSFSPEVFFVALLPPIIFNSGYHLRRELFFRHIVPIILFAVVGTVLSALSIAFLLDFVVNVMGWTNEGFKPHLTELLTFGALISATDPVSTLAVFQVKRVDPHLFYLVFGESVLNDAVGLVLFKAFAKFIRKPDSYDEGGDGNVASAAGISFVEFILEFSVDAFFSPILGLLCCLISALIFKHVDMSTSKLLELSLYVLIAYVPFLLAEMMHLSGIVTILFTGMAARSFVVPNLSNQTAMMAEQLFRLLAHLAEVSIFLELGLSVFGLAVRNFDGAFVGWAILACLLSRALNIYPLTFVHNRMLQQPKSQQSQAAASESDAASEEDGDITKLQKCGWRKNQKQQSQQQHVHVVEMTNSLAKSDHHHVEEMYMASGKSPCNGSTVDGYAVAIMKRQDTDLSSTTPEKQRDMKIEPKTAHMLWFSGLRGAVAYACVRAFPDAFGNRDQFTVATMAIVLTTVFFLGGTTTFCLKLLNINMDVDESRYMDEWQNQREPDTIILRIDEIVHQWLGRPKNQEDYEDVKDRDGESPKEKEQQQRRSKMACGHHDEAQSPNHHHNQHPPIEVSESSQFADVEGGGSGGRICGPPLSAASAAASQVLDKRTKNKRENSDGSLFDFGGNEFCG